MNFDLDIDMLWRMLLAILLGGLIGIEREWFNKSAGLRTMILICMGATAFTMCSQQLGHAGDHARIAANVVVGVGFIGGGVIFKGEGGVNGITTAACIWVTAAIGMLIGSMHWELACIVTAVVILVLFLLSFAEKALDNLHSVRSYRLKFSRAFYEADGLQALLKANRLTLRSRKLRKDGDLMESWLYLQGRNEAHQDFVKAAIALPELLEFEA